MKFKPLEILLMALMILAMCSCDHIKKGLEMYCECQQAMNDDNQPIPLSEQILVCGGAEELTATQSGQPNDEQVPAYHCNGNPVNWWRWKKDTPLPGSGSVKVYDDSGIDYTNTVGYFTPDFQDGVLEGYLSIVTEIIIIDVAQDSAHYVHPQIDSENDCLNGPNSASNGESSSTSIECIEWPKLDGSNVAIGDTIYFIVDL